MKKFFKDFITLKRGYDLPANQRTKGSYPIYSANGINGYHSKFTSDSIGVITGRSGTIGTVMYSKTPYWALNTTLFVDDFKGNIPKYVFYFLNWFDLSRFSTGAVVPTLNRNHLDYIEIDVPDYETQLRITNTIPYSIFIFVKFSNICLSNSAPSAVKALYSCSKASNLA